MLQQRKIPFSKTFKELLIKQSWSAEKTAAAIGVPLLKCFLRFFNGDFVHHYPSLFLREMTPVANPRLLEEERFGFRPLTREHH